MRELIHGCEAMSRGDNEYLIQQPAPDAVFEDHATDLKRVAGGDYASRVQVTTGHFAPVPVAVRGEHLALARVRLTDPDTEFWDESLVIVEIDDVGRTAATVLFDGDDLRGAVTELGRRHRSTMPAPTRETMELLALVEDIQRACFRDLGRYATTRCPDATR
jgi:hypothetical protein